MSRVELARLQAAPVSSSRSGDKSGPTNEEKPVVNDSHGRNLTHRNTGEKVGVHWTTLRGWLEAGKIRPR